MLLRWWAGRLTIRAFLAQGTRPCQGWSWGHLVAGFIPQEARPAAGMKAAVEGQAGQGSKCVLPSGSSAGSEFARHAWCVALHPETELGLELLCFSRKPGHQKEKSQNVSINNQGRWWSRGGGAEKWGAGPHSCRAWPPACVSPGFFWCVLGWLLARC